MTSTVRTLPGVGLSGGWSNGEDGWGSALNQNLLWLSVLARGEVQSRTANLPASPALGAIHIVPEGDAQNANRIAVWDGPEGGEQWNFLDPVRGLTLRVHASNEWVRWSGTAWVSVTTDARLLPDLAGNGDRLLRVNGSGTAISWQTFLSLFPSLSQAAGFRLEVNPASNNIQWTRPGQYAITIHFNGDLVLTQALRERIIEITGPSRIVLPLDSTQTIDTGSLYTVTKITSGVAQIHGAAGVTVNGVAGGEFVMTDQYQAVTVYKRASNEWVISGAFEAEE